MFLHVVKKVRELPFTAASGLVATPSDFFVIADDELALGTFPRSNGGTDRFFPLLPGTLPLAPGARKRVKPDFEALAWLPAWALPPNGALLIVPSLSRPNRTRGVILPCAASDELEMRSREVDWAPVMASLLKDIRAPNIEGATVMGDQMILLQRGNKHGHENATIAFPLKEFIAVLQGSTAIQLQPLVTRVDLGLCKNVPWSFTDGAALADGRLAFTAAAERTDDPYLDGEIVGAALGVLNLDSTVQHLDQLAISTKVEGLWVEQQGDTFNCWMVTDADDPSQQSSLLLTQVTHW